MNTKRIAEIARKLEDLGDMEIVIARTMSGEINLERYQTTVGINGSSQYDCAGIDDEVLQTRLLQLIRERISELKDELIKETK